MGFTLVESIIVLSISTLIMGLLLFSFANFPQNEMKEKAFWRLFNEKWNKSIQSAKLNGRITNVRIWKDGIVEFIYYENKKQNIESIEIPKGLKANKYYSIQITDTGFTKPQTVIWYSDNRHCSIRQKFQLGWGIYYCEDG